MASKFSAWNPYHYTYNNPILYIDPTGLSPECPSDDCRNLSQTITVTISATVEGVTHTLTKSVTVNFGTTKSDNQPCTSNVIVPMFL